mgnify:CR=1 FL=1
MALNVLLIKVIETTSRKKIDPGCRMQGRENGENDDQMQPFSQAQATTSCRHRT